MFRRIILAATALLFLWAAPASAQYVGPLVVEREGTVETTDGFTTFVFTTFGELARTGSNDMVPLAQAGIVLVGGGSLLVLVARRRRTERRNSRA